MDSRSNSNAPSDSRQGLSLLLQAARTGSADALGALFESCRDYLLLVANHELASDIQPKASPSDLVQQSLAEACQDFPRFAGSSDGEVLYWLRRILLNNIRDVTRGFRGTSKRDVRRELSLAEDDSVGNAIHRLASTEPSPSAHAAATEEQLRLNAALERLPPHYAEVIRLRNLDYRSFPEIGIILHLTTDAARKLWERAIERLTRELDSGDDST